MDERTDLEGVVNNKHLNTIKEVILKVVDCYMEFLCNIIDKIIKYSKNKEINERKFNEVRQDLFEF